MRQRTWAAQLEDMLAAERKAGRGTGAKPSQPPPDPSRYIGGLTAAERAALRGALASPGRALTEQEAMALGLLADFNGLAVLARQAVKHLGAQHPVSREIEAILSRVR